jgi:hypothetical protein
VGLSGKPERVTGQPTAYIAPVRPRGEILPPEMAGREERIGKPAYDVARAEREALAKPLDDLSSAVEELKAALEGRRLAEPERRPTVEEVIPSGEKAQERQVLDARQEQGHHQRAATGRQRRRAHAAPRR